MAFRLLASINMNIPADLKPGDILLYSGTGFASDVIKIKEGEPIDGGVSHIEVYAGDGQSWASRDGIGVNLYPFRSDGLQEIRRPVKSFDSAKVIDWFSTFKGAPYGWSDIAESVDLSIPQRGMDCSHFASACMIAGDTPHFDDGYPLNKITPRDFRLSRESVTIWIA